MHTPILHLRPFSSNICCDLLLFRNQKKSELSTEPMKNPKLNHCSVDSAYTIKRRNQLLINKKKGKKKKKWLWPAYHRGAFI